MEERELIGLAFVTAMQLLPPKQRVTVVLRDVLDWSAREVAELLDDTVPAVNSALQRGRDRLERERNDRGLARAHAPASAAEEERVMWRFQEAWAAVDIDGIVALLADDALLTMPPEAQRFEGNSQIGVFFATAPLDGRLDRIQLVPTRTNRQPALAAYADDQGEGVFEAYGVMVFALRGDRIDGITGFARQPALFTRLGLPTQLAAAAEALQRTYVHPMDLTGRPMTGTVYVAPEGLRGNALRTWVEQAAGFARTLPPKRPSAEAHVGRRATGSQATHRGVLQGKSWAVLT